MKVRTEVAKVFTIYYNDYKTNCSNVNDLEQWEDLFYTIFRIDLTWSMAHRIELCENRKEGVFIRCTIKEVFAKNFSEWLSIRGIIAHTYYTKVGFVETNYFDEEVRECDLLEFDE